jgi:hypothetical protein
LKTKPLLPKRRVWAYSDFIYFILAKFNEPGAFEILVFTSMSLHFAEIATMPVYLNKNDYSATLLG